MDAGARVIHVDVMDGHFVPPIMGAVMVKGLRDRSTRLPLEVHLMVDPGRFLDGFAKAGADTLIVHLEVHSARPDPHQGGARAG